MKGPGLRADLEVRRVWQCPRCGASRKALGDVASMTCNCQPEGIFMRLQEPRRQVKTFPHPIDDPTGGEIVPEDSVEDASAEAGALTDNVEGGNSGAPSDR